MDDRVLRVTGTRRAQMFLVAFFALCAVAYAVTVLFEESEPWGLRLAKTSMSVLLLILCWTWLALLPKKRRPRR